ncbi:uncharacterized protein DUF1835 [Breoghania corrubedonensis]|uniref:Uncharacterized protein DUF1835 n=1 Tax=Breoghania corrubedonensis TaxID=665038 RepID=A0A2T5VGX5_9HYPH|nr:DUF1835 domain-containing protein [Breoghania corrubedonensis]PTW62986.1 uncharacterized protein DUF1835 [Breoghania corrubedonensis]
MTHDAAELPLFSDSDSALQLDRLRKKTKALKKALHAREADALDRLRTFHPRADRLDPAKVKLADAQCIIAREAGLSSWPALKAHATAMDAARSDIETGAPAPDSDRPTLHIRRGNDIEAALKRAGFAGDFLEYSDPICQGPIREGADALAHRARFIAREYPGTNEMETLAKLRTAERRLRDAASYSRIVLWFEHDPYDQLLLVRILSLFKETGADRRLVEIVSLDRFPGIEKFHGIGQLSPAALRHMYNTRQPVSDAAYSLALRTWRALLADTALPLAAIAAEETPALPFLSGAVRRYLAEFPGDRDGLSFTQRQCLDLLGGGALPWGQVFTRFMRERDPLPFHGDLMFLGMMLQLAQADDPALTFDETTRFNDDWGKAPFTLTQTGRALLEGRRDWRDCGPRERWLGGLRCFGEPDWRWRAPDGEMLAVER